MHVLRWTGKSVNLACNTETYPFKYNEAARWKAKEAKVNKAKIKEAMKKDDGQKKKRGRRQGEGVPSWKAPAAKGYSDIRDAKRMEMQNMQMHGLYQNEARR